MATPNKQLGKEILLLVGKCIEAGDEATAKELLALAKKVASGKKENVKSAAPIYRRPTKPTIKKKKKKLSSDYYPSGGGGGCGSGGSCGGYDSGRCSSGGGCGR